MTWLAKLTRRLALAPVMTLALLTPAASRAQISPGPLAKPHAQLEGATNCAKCHGLQRQPMSQMCVSCHKEIQALRSARHGLHGTDVAAAGKECASCHPDHAGATFSLVAWSEGSPERFDHRRTGWTLDGKHTAAKCESCHAEKFRTSEVAALSPRQGTVGWVGLDRTCASCHRADDPHRGALGATCEDCHDSNGWTPAPRFDHAKSAYPLTGKHADVGCDKCHRTARLSPRLDARGIRPAVFKPVPHRECSACHDDPHKGRLSPACAECHVTTSFSTLDRRGFNHALTRYALDGRHKSVRCESCHGPQLLQRNPPFATCGSCHADAHAGEATLAGRSVDCAACHTVGGYTPSTFTVAQHATARFALHGRHAAVACSMCHVPVAPAASTVTAVAAPVRAPATKRVRIRVAASRCAECHADAHAGQLAARAGGGSCESCHTDDGWGSSTFGTAAHARLRLPLEGRHAEIPCAACHGLERRGLPAHAKPAAAFGTAKVALALGETSCASCHADPHGGRYGAGGPGAKLGGCAACHGSKSFRPAVMDPALHARFAFTLEGAHLATPCVGCHVEMRATPAARTLVLDAKGVASLPFTTAARTACASCHETPHGRQFAARPGNGACESCHTVTSFRSAERFDHERDARFSLKGAHARVACGRCHRAPPGRGAPQPVVYRGVPSACEACHDARRAGGVH